MLSILSLGRVQTAEIAARSTRKVKQDGVGSFLKAATNRIVDVSNVLLFKALFGSLTREEMIQRAKESGGYWEFGSAEEIEIKPQADKTLEDRSVPELFAEYAGTYDVRRPFVCELNGGLLINAADPLVVDQNRNVVMETEKPLFGARKGASRADTPFHKRTEYSDRSTSDRMGQLCRGYVQSRSRIHEQARFDSVFPLFRRDTSYGHWVLDQLPTLRGLEHYKEMTGRDPTVVIESDPPGWIEETLSLVGVDSAVPLAVPVAKADRLIVSSCRESIPRNQSVYEPSREDITWLSREMKSRAPPTTTKHPDRVYVSRENLADRGRYVSNREDLKRVLDEFDITMCTPETLSIAEQIALYENAEILIGPHGAGLTNMIFSSDTCVIELLNKSYPSYQHLAQLCGHEYHYLQSEGERGHHTPIEIDVAELRELLKRAST
ncbi:glycosyltransferase family 61 protein [Halalkaliarchaeum sp. AArc-GB]|uniref:glycosyltransferase family 61 protein n=1 Tax=Halalkaliarchaeum sp. AArc-GB TaxID=3074078 RepID=UPI00285BD9AE|nr:glycosyltransferase family 61 protein [Halalkaliarchaeum sp. AArc-GB]MDR5672227.1 glycosyltransferase family 61 protein [Halalkaliarchaeum sp. AArc-GB]